VGVWRRFPSQLLGGIVVAWRRFPSQQLGGIVDAQASGMRDSSVVARSSERRAVANARSVEKSSLATAESGVRP